MVFHRISSSRGSFSGSVLVFGGVLFLLFLGGPGGLIFFKEFTLLWGRWAHFDEHIFQLGWNHQSGSCFLHWKEIRLKDFNKKSACLGYKSYFKSITCLWPNLPHVFSVGCRVWPCFSARKVCTCPMRPMGFSIFSVETSRDVLGGGNSFFFYLSSPSLGKWSNFTNIFQMGWNHQLEEMWGELRLNFEAAYMGTFHSR